MSRHTLDIIISFILVKKIWRKIIIIEAFVDKNYNKLLPRMFIPDGESRTCTIVYNFPENFFSSAS